MAKKFILVVSSEEYEKYCHNYGYEPIAELRIGNVVFHRDLITSGEVCFGGGLWERDGKTLRLSDQSYDFGPPRWGAIKNIRLDEDILKAFTNIVYTYPKQYQYKDMEDIDVIQLLEFE